MTQSQNNNLQPIYQAAVDLFKRLGLKSVSMDDIARELGMSKKTLYQMVENKEDLIAKVMKCDFEADKAMFARNANEAIDAIDEYLRNSRYFIREMREISPTTLHDLQKYYPKIWREMFQDHHQQFQLDLIRNLERGMEEGLYRENLDPEVISTLYSGMMGMVIDRQAFPNHERPLSDIVRQMTEYHFQGIVNQFGRDRLDNYLKTEALE